MSGTKIHNVVLQEGPIYTKDGFSVYVGYVDFKNDQNDLPHYLIVNDQYNVIEASTARLTQARAIAWALAKETDEQDVAINRDEALVKERDNDSPFLN